ncbi:MAG: polysaccharide pyruvyl transferase CsaB [Oscillospiraceae bacterium]|nr:polysaccharide pyruvyl transferase CsaB [Oscillospiraceae bacterium]
MKVLTLISGGDTGGAKTHVLSLLRELSRTIDVQLVCFMKGAFSEEAAAMGIPTEVIEGNPLSALRKLRRLAEAFRCDIIHCHGARGNFMGMLLQKSVKAPLLSTVHSDYKLDYLGRPTGAAVYGTLNAIALRHMDFLAGVSDSMSSLLIRRGFDPAKIFTIYNGITFDHTPQDFDRSAWFRSLGLDIPEDAIVAGIAARLDPVKDIPTLLHAFAQAHRRVAKLRLLIAGDGQQMEALQKLALALGVENEVHFLGWLHNTEDFYRAIDINTLSSRSETFPYALTEGTKFFLPTVSSRVGGVPQLIDHGVNGLLFEPGDRETLAEHLVSLALDADKRRTMGLRLGEKARREFSLEASCRRQLEIYETALRRYARRDELKNQGIMICGAYGHGNAGDEAILEAIVTEMHTLDKDLPITVLSRTPKETAVRCGVRAKHSFDLFGVLRAMRRTRLFLCGGGTLMQDATSSRSLWYYLFMLAAAKRLGCRVLMYGCGIGPLHTAFDRRLARKMLNRHVDAITLRESTSLRELESLGVTKPELTLSADPALSLPRAGAEETDAALRAHGLSPEGHYAAFCLRLWPGFDGKVEAFADTARYAWQAHGLTPVFLSINHRSDGAAAEKVCALLGDVPHVLLHEPMPTGLTIGLLSRMELVLSMRLHGLIFAVGCGIPHVGVAYDKKVTAFMDYTGQKNHLPFDAAEAEKLCALLDSALTCSKPEELAAAARILFERESNNIAAAKRLLES